MLGAPGEFSDLFYMEDPTKGDGIVVTIFGTYPNIPSGYSITVNQLTIA